MDMIYRCARCGLTLRSDEYKPYMQDGVAVRPDTCPTCAWQVETLRKKYPVDWRWFEILRKEEKRKLNKRRQRGAAASPHQD
jgi:hypothetical protein